MRLSPAYALSLYEMGCLLGSSMERKQLVGFLNSLSIATQSLLFLKAF